MMFDYREALTAHEAGHALVAHHYGFDMVSFNLDPIPHCLIDQRGATRHQLGVMLCAGGAATEMIYGEPIGEYHDYKMAAILGDVEGFHIEAMSILKSNLPAFWAYEGLMFGDMHPEALSEGEEGWAEIHAAYHKAANPSEKVKRMVKRMLWIQYRLPKLMGFVVSAQQAVLGRYYRIKDRLTKGVLA